MKGTNPIPTGPILDPKRRWIGVQSSNVGAVRYYRTHNGGWLDVVFKRLCNRHPLLSMWTIECSECRPEIFYRYKNVLVEDFVDMLFADSVGSFFTKEIKAASEEEPEKLELEWQW